MTGTNLAVVAPSIQYSSNPVSASAPSPHHWLIGGLLGGLVVATIVLAPVLWYEYHSSISQELKQMEQIWKELLTLTQRTYSRTEQQLERYAVVATNAVTLLESSNPFWAINGLLDLSVYEFKTLLGTFNITSPHWAPNAHKIATPTQPPPINYDVCSTLGCTEIKDQGLCGSCWAYSTIAIAESALQKTQGASQPTPLTATPILACVTSNGNAGCSGGYPSAAAAWTIETGTTIQDDSLGSDWHDFETEWFTSIPSCSDFSVNTNTSQSVLVGWKYGMIWYADPITIASLMVQLGPAVVFVDSSAWQFVFTSDIYTDSGSCSSQLQNANHAVVLTGFGVDSGVAYWTIRNSWGGLWGDDGYLRIQQAGNTCGITNIAMWLVPPSKVENVCGTLLCSD
jgi:hypothetical protein